MHSKSVSAGGAGQQTGWEGCLAPEALPVGLSDSLLSPPPGWIHISHCLDFPTDAGRAGKSIS